MHTTESIGWFNSLSILINGTGLKRWIDSFRYSYSSAFEISYPWSSDIEEYRHSIQMPKCGRTIDITNTTINYQLSTHASDLIYYQIDKSMVCDSLINNRANDWWIDCWIDWMANPTWFPFQFNRILSILVSLLLLSRSPPSFLCCDRFLLNKAKSISYFNIYDCIVLSIYWTMDSQKWIIITNKCQSIRTILMCHYQIQSSWLSEATSLLSILNKY